MKSKIVLLSLLTLPLYCIDDPVAAHLEFEDLHSITQRLNTQLDLLTSTTIKDDQESIKQEIACLFNERIYVHFLHRLT